MIVGGITGLPDGDLAWSLVDMASGMVWSPAAGAFVPGDAPADALRPLLRVAGDAHRGLGLAFDPATPDLAPGDQWWIYVHDAATGEIVNEGVPVSLPARHPLALALAIGA